jgi:drug/metabolite transporter (DMT)-like permease
MELWVKNTSGQKSASLTFVCVGFSVVTLWLVVSIVSKIGHFDIRPFDGSAAMGYLTPLLALYFGRRWTDGSKILDIDPRSEVEPDPARGTSTPAEQ